VSGSRFVRRIPVPIDRWWGDAPPDDALEEPSPPDLPDVSDDLRSRFLRRVAVQPSPFQVDRPLRHPIPARAMPVSPVRVEVFLARVDDRLGDVLPLTVWELPSWRRLETALDLSTLDRSSELEGEDPLPGDLLWLWTWTDLPDEGEPIDRIYVRLERPPVSAFPHPLAEGQPVGVVAPFTFLLAEADPKRRWPRLPVTLPPHATPFQAMRRWEAAS